jgi:hypothetical protein
LVGEDLDDFVDVSVCGGAGNPVIASQGGHIGAVAEPPQAHHGLPEAGQRPDALSGAAPAALGRQQPGEVVDQFPRDVEHGSIDDHVEPFGGRVDLVVNLFCRRLHGHFRDMAIHPGTCPSAPFWSHQLLTVRTELAEITSLTVKTIL